MLHTENKQKNLSCINLTLLLIRFFLRLIDEKSGFNEDRDLLNKLRYIVAIILPFRKLCRNKYQINV